MQKEDFAILLLALFLVAAMVLTWLLRDNSKSMHGHGALPPAPVFFAVLDMAQGHGDRQPL